MQSSALTDSISLPKRSVSRSVILTAGLSIFAMQFGAGNIVFALSIGHFAQDKTFFATLGLILSGVIVPLLGLIAMSLFDGDYKTFFSRLGKWPGFLITVLILGLLGPFGAIPRCLALSYSTSKAYLPAVSLEMFSGMCCAFIFALTAKRSSIFEVIGYFLTPIKLGSLLLLVVFGLVYASTLPVSSQNEFGVFIKGINDGYQPMDLLGAFFICSIILEGLRRNIGDMGKHTFPAVLSSSVKASCIGYALLAIIYFGFSFTAAFHSATLDGVPPQELVSKIATIVLGSFGGLFISFAVTIACLTTAIALSTVFAEFIHTDISKGKVSYPLSLVITLAITFVISTLDFTGIIKMLTPVLALFYPALIVLTVVNILYKLKNFQSVKVPVFATLAASAILYYIM